jgi:hypothetical protein
LNRTERHNHHHHQHAHHDGLPETLFTMGFFCANHYADPRCYNNVPKFGDFCTACIVSTPCFQCFPKPDSWANNHLAQESKRGWSMEALDGRVDSRTGGDSTTTSPTQGSQQPIARDSGVQQAAQPAYRSTSLTT